MKNVALFGGAFDPPTKGHMAVAEAVLELPHIDELWFMPCYAHMFGKIMQPYSKRVTMLKRLCYSSPKLSVFTFEKEHNLTNGSTYELLNVLQNDEWYRKYSFSFIIGLDNADTLYKWCRWEDIIKMTQFIVVPRDGKVPSKAAWYSKGRHRIVHKDIPHISSTLVRKYLQKGELENARGILTRDVFEYVVDNNLYGSKY